MTAGVWKGVWACNACVNSDNKEERIQMQIYIFIIMIKRYQTWKTELNKPSQKHRRRNTRAYTRVIGLTRHTSKQSRGNKAKLQTKRLQHKSTKNTNRRYITDLWHVMSHGHQTGKHSRRTSILSLLQNLILLRFTLYKGQYIIHRCIYKIHFCISELKGKWLQPPQASNKARILYRQYRDAFERAIHTLKKSVMTQKHQHENRHLP